MGRLSFTIGLPRGGKSTFCRVWLNEFDDDKPSRKRVVLSGDDFRYAVYDQRFSPVGEELVRGCLITAARALYRAGYHVMIDETNTTPYHIRQILNIDENAVAILFYTDTETCIERAIDCNQQDLIEPIKRMNNNLQSTLAQIKDKTLPVRYVWPMPIGGINAKSNQ